MIIFCIRNSYEHDTYLANLVLGTLSLLNVHLVFSVRLHSKHNSVPVLLKNVANKQKQEGGEGKDAPESGLEMANLILKISSTRII